MGIDRWYPRGQTQPLTSASAWDILILAGSVLPGRARITKASAAWKYDPKKKPGADAHRGSILHFDPKPIGFEILCVEAEHVDAVNKILAPFIPAPGAEGKPATIQHVSIDHLKGVKSMQILEVSEWAIQSDRRLKLTVSGDAWVGSDKPIANAKTKSKVRTPTRSINNKRSDDAKKRGKQGGANPDPTKDPTFARPTFQPGG